MKICIVGAGGRMGQMLVRQIASHPDCTLGAATERTGSNLLGRDAGELAGVGRLDAPITDDAAAAIARCAAVIDFTAPAGLTLDLHDVPVPGSDGDAAGMG